MQTACEGLAQEIEVEPEYLEDLDSTMNGRRVSGAPRRTSVVAYHVTRLLPQEVDSRPRAFAS
jgi:hypothetical protein